MLNFFKTKPRNARAALQSVIYADTLQSKKIPAIRRGLDSAEDNNKMPYKYFKNDEEHHNPRREIMSIF